MNFDAPSISGFLLGLAVALVVTTVAAGSILLASGSKCGAAIIMGGVGVYLAVLSYRI